MKPTFEEDDICIVKSKRHGSDYLPVIPSKQGDDATQLKEGIILKCVGKREMGTEVYLYEMQVMTGRSSGDTVYVSDGVAHFLEQIPSK